MSKNEIIIKSVGKGSIAEEAGVEEGDILLSINGNSIEDIIEYRYLINDENLELVIRKSSGEEWEIEVEKDFYEDLGIEFEDDSMEGPKRCHNKCVFCFIDQLPPGMRESLYFKDDDSRLSFLHGNFITLTNLKNEDIERIIKFRISPINISVHTTNPELRIKMLNNKNAGNIFDIIKKLVDGGIRINCQIVLCPGINDGCELVNTLKDLYELFPGVQNVAVVPVGISRYRDKLFGIEGYAKESSKQVIDIMTGMQRDFMKANGTPFARLADEFYITAGVELPSYEHYDDFEQLEDGIGMIRYFESRIKEDLEYTEYDGGKRELALVTGVSSSSFMNEISREIENKLNIKITVYPVKNEFFGERITVTGLITGGDIIKQIKGIIKEKTLLIPTNMFKADEDIFLDDIKLSDLEKELDVSIIKCKYTGDDLIDKIVNEVL